MIAGAILGGLSALLVWQHNYHTYHSAGMIAAAADPSRHQVHVPVSGTQSGLAPVRPGAATGVKAPPTPMTVVAAKTPLPMAPPPSQPVVREGGAVTAQLQLVPTGRQPDSEVALPVVNAESKHAAHPALANGHVPPQPGAQAAQRFSGPGMQGGAASGGASPYHDDSGRSAVARMTTATANANATATGITQRPGASAAAEAEALTTVQVHDQQALVHQAGLGVSQLAEQQGSIGAGHGGGLRSRGSAGGPSSSSDLPGLSGPPAPPQAASVSRMHSHAAAMQSDALHRMAVAATLFAGPGRPLVVLVAYSRRAPLYTGLLPQVIADEHIALQVPVTADHDGATASRIGYGAGTVFSAAAIGAMPLATLVRPAETQAQPEASQSQSRARGRSITAGHAGNAGTLAHPGPAPPAAEAAALAEEMEGDRKPYRYQPEDGLQGGSGAGLGLGPGGRSRRSSFAEEKSPLALDDSELPVGMHLQVHSHPEAHARPGTLAAAGDHVATAVTTTSSSTTSAGGYAEGAVADAVASANGPAHDHHDASSPVVLQSISVIPADSAQRSGSGHRLGDTGSNLDAFQSPAQALAPPSHGHSESGPQRLLASSSADLPIVTPK